MSIKSVLTVDTTKVGLAARDKPGVIKEMIGLLVAAGCLRAADADAAEAAVLEREARLSTGMKYGIAIPHGKTSTVDHLIACIGVSEHPIPFDSLDGEPSRIFIMTISSPEKHGPHLQFLAEVSQLFKDGTKRAKVLAARTAQELLTQIIG
jgi:PTS system nitrogen regulatory IIA component